MSNRQTCTRLALWARSWRWRDRRSWGRSGGGRSWRRRRWGRSRRRWGRSRRRWGRRRRRWSRRRRRWGRSRRRWGRSRRRWGRSRRRWGRRRRRWGRSRRRWGRSRRRWGRSRRRWGWGRRRWGWGRRRWGWGAATAGGLKVGSDLVRVDRDITVHEVTVWNLGTGGANRSHVVNAVLRSAHLGEHLRGGVDWRRRIDLKSTGSLARNVVWVVHVRDELDLLDLRARGSGRNRGHGGNDDDELGEHGD